MAEEEVVKKTTSGNVRKYADNILPMVFISKLRPLAYFPLLNLFVIDFQARIKKIMKMDPNITDNINVEANYLVCAATEIFIRHLAKDV